MAASGEPAPTQASLPFAASAPSEPLAPAPAPEPEPVPVPVPTPAPASAPAPELAPAPVPAALTPQPPLSTALAVQRHWLVSRLADFAKLMRLDRPIGIWLLLWPTLWALWTASGGHPQRGVLLIFVLGTLLMRSAGCVINDFIDRNIDPHVRRTRDRPLAARRVSPVEALLLFFTLLAGALALVLQLNSAAIRLSFIGAALTATYPLLKRFFALPQLYLGVCFGWGVPMAFAAELGAVPRVGWVMLLAAIVWACVYDTFYAIADRPDDLRIGIKSSAITFGDMDLLMIGAMQLMVLVALGLIGRLLELGAPYYISLGVGAVLFAWQQWSARNRDSAGCLAAFHNNNYFGLVVLAGLIIDYTSKS